MIHIDVENIFLFKGFSHLWLLSGVHNTAERTTSDFLARLRYGSTFFKTSGYTLDEQLQRVHFKIEKASILTMVVSASLSTLSTLFPEEQNRR